MPLSTQDFTAGIDFTALLTANGSQHNQLIENGEPTDDGAGLGRGLVIATIDGLLNVPQVPDAASTTKWKRYLWRRNPHVSATLQIPKLYAWVENAVNDVVFYKWVETSIPTSVLDEITDIRDDIAEIRQLAKDSTYIISTTGGNSAIGANVRILDFVVNMNRALFVGLGAGILKCLVGGDYIISGFAMGHNVNHLTTFQKSNNELISLGSMAVGVGVAVNTPSIIHDQYTLQTNALYKLVTIAETVVADGLGKISAALQTVADTAIPTSFTAPILARVNLKRIN